jgi:thiamine-monophosphate kinase
MGDLGEWGIIAALAARVPAGPLTQIGIGDDAAVLATPSGSVVAAVDLLIENRHFRLDWSSARDIGAKAAARSLADIAAMGAASTALLIGLAAPGTLPAKWAADLADGLAAEAKRAGAGVIGGDTARADTVTLSVTALGDLQGRPPVRRSGARPGDVVAVSGHLGLSAAGLALLKSGVTEAVGDPAVPGSVAKATMLDAHRCPKPSYPDGPEAARLGATAMIDVSDGLLADLGHIADASGVAIDLERNALPLDTGLREVAWALAVLQEKSTSSSGGTRGAAHSRETALHWVLTGGEDHALVATFPPSVTLPSNWRVIGAVLATTGLATTGLATTGLSTTGLSTTGGSSTGGSSTGGSSTGHARTGVTIDGAPYAGPGGWDHFRHP